MIALKEILAGSKVFTIPGCHSFVNSLAKGLLAQFGDSPEALSKAKILLPTRRACRALRDAILIENDGTPVLLPQLLPLGDIDEDELQISGPVIMDGVTGFDYASRLQAASQVQ